MKTLAMLLAAAALSFAAAPAAPAHACGDTHQPDHGIVERATATVDASFAAIAAGNTKAFKKLWSKAARVTSIAPSGKSSSMSVAKAVKRWMKRLDGFAWTVVSVTPTQAGAEVHATVTWNGTTYDDVLMLKDYGDRLVIMDKTTTARAAVTEAFHY